MEKLRCKRCGRELEETKNGFYCKSCYVKYAVINGELQLLECKSCGGELSDHGDHYACNLCGKRYKKEVLQPKLADEVSELGKFCSDCEKIFMVKETEEITALAEDLKASGTEALNRITEIEDMDLGIKSVFVICTRFLAAIKYLRHKTYTLNNISPYKMKEETIDEMMKSIDSFRKNMEMLSVTEEAISGLEHTCACFLIEILKICDESLTKMIAERAAGVFTGSTEKESMEEYCPNILEIISFCEERMETPQEEFTEEYWEGHPEDYDELVYEKEMLEKEREKLQQEEKIAIAAEEKRVGTVKREIKKLEKKWEAARDRSIRLNFFQKKEKKRLDEEMFGLTVQKKTTLRKN